MFIDKNIFVFDSNNSETKTTNTSYNIHTLINNKKKYIIIIAPRNHSPTI